MQLSFTVPGDEITPSQAQITFQSSCAIFTYQPYRSGAFTACALHMALSSSLAAEPGQLPNVLPPNMPTAGAPHPARGGDW